MEPYRDEKETLRRRVIALEEQVGELTEDDVDAAARIAGLHAQSAMLEREREKYKRRALEAEAQLAALRASEAEQAEPSDTPRPSGAAYAITASAMLLLALVGSAVRGGTLLAASALLAALFVALLGSSVSKRQKTESDERKR